HKHIVLMADSLLLGLWTLSLAMAFVSVGAFCLLVVQRYLSRKRKIRNERIHDETINALLLAMDDRDEAVRKLVLLTRNRETFMQTWLEYASLVRGQDLLSAIEALQAAGAETKVVEALTQGRMKYRRVAAETLGFFNSDDARHALSGALEGKSPTPVKVAAARSLLALGQKPDLADILPQLDLRALEAPLEMAAIFHFFARDNPEPIIRRVRMGIDDEELQLMMIEALGRCDVYDAIPVLEACMADDSGRIRAAAIEALGSLELPIDATVMEKALSDESSEVRAEAAQAIGNVVMPDYADRLEALLSDEDWNVRFSAAAAMLELGADGRSRIEAVASRSPTERAQRAASLILSERTAA
ncbi:MAG: HEAT repeat domain-containing protein, partial [Henriciella sp.]